MLSKAHGEATQIVPCSMRSMISLGQVQGLSPRCRGQLGTRPSPLVRWFPCLIPCRDSPLFWEWKQNSSCDLFRVCPAHSPASVLSTLPSPSGVLLVSRVSVLPPVQSLCTSCSHCLECFDHLSSSLDTSSSVLSLASLIRKKPQHVFSKNCELFLSGAYHNYNFTLLDCLVSVGVPCSPGDCELCECRNRSVLAHHSAQHSF